MWPTFEAEIQRYSSREKIRDFSMKVFFCFHFLKSKKNDTCILIIKLILRLPNV